MATPICRGHGHRQRKIAQDSESPLPRLCPLSFGAIDEEGNPYSPDYSYLDLGLYPATLTLTANGGLRQLSVSDAMD
jgi:hypothetical protein